MRKLIAGATAIAIAAMATQASAMTVTYTTNSIQGIANGQINYWFFTGSGSLSFADGLANGIYDQSILTSFNQTNSFVLNLKNPPNFNFTTATWDFGLADLNNFSLEIQDGIPVQAAFTLGPKLPTSATSDFASTPFSYSFDSSKDPDPTAAFLIGTLDRGIQLTGDFNAAVAAAPEPTTWALMLVGFGAVGGALRRGKRVSVSYA
jgi:hypothetical protein